MQCAVKFIGKCAWNRTKQAMVQTLVLNADPERSDRQLKINNNTNMGLKSVRFTRCNTGEILS